VEQWLYQSRLLLLSILEECNRLSRQLSELDTRCCGNISPPLNGRTAALAKLRASFSSLRMACASCASMIEQLAALGGSAVERGKRLSLPVIRP